MKKLTVYGSRCKNNPDHEIQYWSLSHSTIYNQCSCGINTSYAISKAFPEGMEHYLKFKIEMTYKNTKDYEKAIDDGIVMMNKNPEKYQIENYYESDT